MPGVRIPPGAPDTLNHKSRPWLHSHAPSLLQQMQHHPEWYAQQIGTGQEQGFQVEQRAFEQMHVEQSLLLFQRWRHQTSWSDGPKISPKHCRDGLHKPYCSPRPQLLARQRTVTCSSYLAHQRGLVYVPERMQQACYVAQRRSFDDALGQM